MDDRRLVLVERFEDLKTGMRVVVDCEWCARREVGILGKGETCEVEFENGPGIEDNFDFFGNCDLILPCISRFDVEGMMVFRIAYDINNDANLAKEENPYKSRQAIGTNGVDEVRVAAKERTR